MLDKKVIERIARQFLEAEHQCKAVDPISDQYPDITVEDAYRIQLQVMKWKKEAGQIIVGKKIGLTSRQMQDSLGVHEPDYGHIFNYMVIQENQPIGFSRLIQPKVEGEIAFILEKDLRGPGITAADVLEATSAVAPAIEVIDSRVKNWKIKICDTVADNASSSCIILGKKTLLPSQLDLRYVGMVLEKNGEIISTGAGAAVMGNPAQSVAWLANKLSEFGDSLNMGEVIMSGSVTAAVKVTPGDIFEVTFDHLGAVTAKFIA
jgi:2-oxopent-4-enoate hydratase